MAIDAYYFSHDSNAKDDPKCVLLIEQLGLEGYGIYWVLVEMLRDQPGYRYPLTLIPAISRRYNTTYEKMKTVINNYQLFEVDEHDFFSLSLMKRMEHLDDKRIKAVMAGKKSGAARALISNVPDEQKENIPQVYVIRCFNDKEEFIKIGSTNGTISRRFSGHLPYQYQVLRQIFSTDHMELETELQGSVASYKYHPDIVFGGNAECYTMDAINNAMGYEPATQFSREHRFNIGSTIKVNQTKPNEIISNEDIESSFNSVWSIYPSKKGKAQVKKTQKTVLFKLGVEKLTSCVNAYIKYVEGERKKGFKDLGWQNGSTFFNGGYEDYLNTPELDKPKRPPMTITVEERD